MDPTIAINERVDVFTIFKKGKQPGKNSFPWRMRYQSRDIEFTKLAFYHPTSVGKRMVHVFDMSDGSTDYRLEFDAENLTWTLVAVIEGQT
jgi:hypothetical protein